MEPNTNNIYALIETALKNLKDPNIMKYHGTMDTESFFSEFRLLTINLPRQSGATTAAKALVDEYRDSLLIVPSQHMSRTIGIENSSINVTHYRNIRQEWFRGRNLLDLIIIDSCRQIPPMEINRLINNLKLKTRLFVVLG